MPNSYPEWRDFLHQTTIMGSVSCILFLRQLHLGLNMYSFINFMQSRNNYIFIPRHTKSGGVLCYTLRTLNVRPSSIHLSVSASFPCSNFSTFWLIFFRLCIDIDIGKEWYGIASGLISFWNNRVMALDVCQKCFALRFRALTLEPFYRFSSDFAKTLLSDRSGMGLQVG